ncbi:MAG: bifunctional oligoribonuclease/PAP phosphatase NrnA [Corallococcus sp.]|nr:bifunctional oligoribonuclease/PAP phosphatase NrnA [Corallococcus sp.]MCM1359615.1 bifunctional oligoribonuclease/PAP phosphatase NrnA [Corallococcus sp.]MCM1395207.1 bifunctional oligoribonuclease/PAP phosphatase NrnA [Corallococcus sp.]
MGIWDDLKNGLKQAVNYDKNKPYVQAWQSISKYDTIIIHRHKNPDGDAIGSQTGLKLVLKHNFPEKKIYAVGDDPKRYGFVEGSVPDEVADAEYENALAIVLDSADTHLVSDERYKTAKATLRFDHHIFVTKFCDVEIVDTAFESCAGLVANFVQTCNWEIPQNAAKAFFTGMVTDSGRFRYDSTTPKTLRVAADLLDIGFDLNDVYTPLYADDFDMIKLRAQFVLNVQFTKNNVAYIYTDKQRVKDLGIDTFTVSRGMVGVMSDIRGVDVWVNFTETDEGVLCELRSKKHNVNPIAVKYGGGGHAKASGACVCDKETALAMLADLDLLAKE